MRKIKLPLPEKDFPLNQLLSKRKSERKFKNQPLDIHQIGELLWAGLGKSNENFTIPSAGALYPLELFILVGEETDFLAKGLYYYDKNNHLLEKLIEKDLRRDLSSACLNQTFIEEAPISIIISASYPLTTSVYGKRGIRYVDMEVGHSCQNIYLKAEELNLSTVEIGAFSEEEVKRLLYPIAERKLEIIAIMPIGYPG